MIPLFSVKSYERVADMRRHNKSMMTYTHILIAAGDEFVLFDERDICHASAHSED